MDSSFIKTKSGLLKLVHVVLGSIAFWCFIGIILYVRSHTAETILGSAIVLSEGVFYTFLVLFAFTLTSFLLLITYIIEEPGDGVKSLFELVYHLCGFILLIAAGITLAVPLSKAQGKITASTVTNLYYTTMICTFLNSFAYGANVIVTYKLRKN